MGLAVCQDSADALIRFGGSGGCHSDLPAVHEWAPENFPPVAQWSLPYTLGYENAGWVEAGDRGVLDAETSVAISLTWNCGTLAITSE